MTDTLREEIIVETVLDHAGCVCDPPGSGEEFCTGHCYLRAENERLRAALEEITELELEGDASLADAMHIADEALHP